MCIPERFAVVCALYRLPSGTDAEHVSQVQKILSAREAGFRMPAEWEPHERCWMQWP